MTSPDWETNQVGDTIQGGKLFSISLFLYMGKLIKFPLKVKLTRNHTIIPLPHRGSSPLLDGQYEAIICGKMSLSSLT